MSFDCVRRSATIPQSAQHTQRTATGPMTLCQHPPQSSWATALRCTPRVSREHWRTGWIGWFYTSSSSSSSWLVGSGTRNGRSNSNGHTAFGSRFLNMLYLCRQRSWGTCLGTAFVVRCLAPDGCSLLTAAKLLQLCLVRASLETGNFAMLIWEYLFSAAAQVARASPCAALASCTATCLPAPKFTTWSWARPGSTALAASMCATSTRACAWRWSSSLVAGLDQASMSLRVWCLTSR